MTHIKNISIPQPCSQSWQQMTPVEQGRHCESCCKTVVDFTPMSNDEIKDFWHGFCKRQGVSDALRAKGDKKIDEDPEHWADQTMHQLLEEISR